jgi:beta-1,4-mannosyl-glycoprotein beta-1,4-N-acetylglucosaminyltransferase
MYFDEDLLLDLRLNYLDKFVDKFIIIECNYNHKGETKKPRFNKEKYKKFENKIEYILLKEQPEDIESINVNDNEHQTNSKYILNAVKRENFQRNYIKNCLSEAGKNDWIIISDLDEVPNLKSVNFNNINNQFIFFKQDMMYYKFNLKLENCTWVGTKACRMKNLKSPQWLRNIKDKSYPRWRLDTLFSKNKYQDIKFIDNGGWHFSYLKTPEEIEKKLKSYLHHREYELNPIGVDKIKNLIEQKKTVYNLKIDQRLNQFNSGNKLNKIDINLLPKYILENKDKLQKWIES